MENLENIHNIADTGTMPPEEGQAVNPGPGTDSTTADMARLIEEAEQRGYLRGRNEKITETVMPPDRMTAESDDDEDIEDSCPSFLAHIRPGFWGQ